MRQKIFNIFTCMLKYSYLFLTHHISFFIVCQYIPVLWGFYFRWTHKMYKYKGACTFSWHLIFIVVLKKYSTDKWSTRLQYLEVLQAWLQNTESRISSVHENILMQFVWSYRQFQSRIYSSMYLNSSTVSWGTPALISLIPQMTGLLS